MTIETSLAIRGYGASRGGGAGLGPAAGTAPDGLSFSEALANAARMMSDSLRQGESAAAAAVRGDGDVQTLVEALSQTELALETAVTVRDRVVEAYQEILRMPV